MKYAFSRYSYDSTVMYDYYIPEATSETDIIVPSVAQLDEGLQSFLLLNDLPIVISLTDPTVSVVARDSTMSREEGEKHLQLVVNKELGQYVH